MRARALARQSNILARENALGHLDIEHALLRHEPTLGVYLRDAQAQLSRAAVQRRLEIEQHFRVVIFAVSRMECAAAARSRPRARTEQRLEEVAVVRIAGTRPAEFEPGVPIGGRTKLFAGARSLSQLIIGGAL